MTAESDQRGFTARDDAPLVGVMLDKNGEAFTHYFIEDGHDGAERSSATLEAALNVIGAWSDLNGDEMASALDEIRHASLPTPPIDP